jgi:hypothetical protein
MEKVVEKVPAEAISRCCEAKGDGKSKESQGTRGLGCSWSETTLLRQLHRYVET